MATGSTYPSGGRQSNKNLPSILLEKGYATQAQMDEAVRIKKEKGGRLEFVLAGLGYVSRQQLYEAMAARYGLRFEPAPEKYLEDIDKRLLEKTYLSEIIKFDFIPYKLKGDELTILTSEPFETFQFKPDIDEGYDKLKHDALPYMERTQKQRKELLTLFNVIIANAYDYMEEHTGSKTEKFIIERFKVKSIKQIVITNLDLMNIAEKLFRSELLMLSIWSLYYKKPEESAYKTFTKKQGSIFVAIIASIGLLLYFNFYVTLLTIIYIMQGFYVLSLLFKSLLTLSGITYPRKNLISPSDIEELSHKELPVYSVLVPVYKEKEVIRMMMEGLKNLNYPQDRLDVIIILEEDDKETLQIVQQEIIPANWRYLVVPNRRPKTKPKACNYALPFAKGKYLVIYDAEDVPEPDQLKTVVAAFAKNRGKNILCFQAALNYYNKNDNFLTRMFTLEYSYWFDYMVPGLDTLNFPIPLGGTSNHFDTQGLKKIGGWDPYNTTEDADLGIRACAEGYKVSAINTTTYEEASANLGNWIRQRTRWIKGYMQTWFVFSRRPFELLNKMGFKAWLSFNFFIGGTFFTFIVSPIMWGIFWLTKINVLKIHFAEKFIFIFYGNLTLSVIFVIWLHAIGVFRRRNFALLPYALLSSIYLILHSVAAYRALWQLIVNPAYWEKTQHGLTKQWEKGMPWYNKI